MVFDFDQTVEDIVHAGHADMYAHRRVNGPPWWLMPILSTCFVLWMVVGEQLMVRYLSNRFLPLALQANGIVFFAFGALMFVLPLAWRGDHRPVGEFLQIPPLRPRVAYWTLMVVVPLAAVIGEFMVEANWPPPQRFTSPRVVRFLHYLTRVPLLLYLVLLPANALFHAVRRRSVLRRMSRSLDHVRGEATETGLTVDDGSQRSEFRWHAIRRYLETQEVFLLYLSQTATLVLPKRGFTAAGAAGFRELLRERVTQSTQAFETIPLAQVTGADRETKERQGG